jgi:PAS domain S-box-containing protein
VVLGRDITDRLLASQRLEVAGARLAQLNRELEQRVEERTRQLTESEEMFRTIAASVNSAVFLVNPEGQISFWNQAAEQMTGWTAGEVLGRDIVPLLGLPGDLWSCDSPASPYREIFTRERTRMEVSARRRDESQFPFEFSLTLVSLRGRPHIVGLGNDISERRQAEQELERYAWEVEDLYNRAPCGYHSLDPEGKIIQINHTELNWLGYTREEMIGRRMTDFFTPASQEIFARDFLGFSGKDRISNHEIELVRRDGSILPVILNGVAVRDAAGRFLRTRTTLFDNTERRKVEQQLHRALALAAAANRAKTDFLATMSHEIRTPMNAIMGYAQLLRRQADLPETARMHADIIGRNGQNLLSLLNSILELSQIEEGRVNMNPEVFSPRQLGAELVSLFQETAQSKGLELTFAAASSVPEEVEADQDKLRRALANLLSNAVKFTEQGRVELSLSATGPADGHWQVVAEVRDTGPGISAEELPRLFNRFAQTTTGRRAGTGTGLGLYISNQYARLLGGTLTVQSTPGVGSIFRLEWTAQATAQPVAAPDSDRLPVLPAESPPCRVLVVDDVVDSREMLAELLRVVGFQVRLAGDGREALVAATDWSPHLVLMDAHMPGMDGGEATRQLRAQGGLLQPKIIIVSAAAFEWNRAAALVAGADDFIAKPCRDRDLLEKIRDHLQLTFQPEPAAASGSAPGRVDPAELDRLGPAVRQQLHDAVLAADYDRLRRRLAEIRDQAPVTVGHLEKLAAQFEAETLLRELAG